MIPGSWLLSGLIEEETIIKTERIPRDHWTKVSTHVDACRRAPTDTKVLFTRRAEMSILRT
jgi:hypothetical protein